MQIAEPINACSFAAGLSGKESGVGAAFGAFRGQMGCLYLFDEVLNPGGLCAQSMIGPYHTKTHEQSGVITAEHASLMHCCYIMHVQFSS